MGNVAGFLPKRNGLHYSNNAWPSAPDFNISTPFGNIPVGDAANGLCGGMVFAVRDLFDAGRLPPTDTTNPPAGSAAFNYVVARLLDSFNIPLGVIEYYTWMNLPTHDTWLGPTGTSDLTINHSMPTVRTTIDANQPCPLGLVCVHSSDPTMLGHNHVVLAWGYEESGPTTTVRVYDPNLPDDDDVTISFDHTNPAHTTAFNDSAGDTVLGFFPCTWYGPHDPSSLFADVPPPPPPPLATLMTRCEPQTLKLNVPQTFEVMAIDPRTSRPVMGNVLANGVRIGLTGTRITYTFHWIVRPPGIGRGLPPEPREGFEPTPPAVYVEAPGYQFSRVAIQFE